MISLPEAYKKYQRVDSFDKVELFNSCKELGRKNRRLATENAALINELNRVRGVCRGWAGRHEEMSEKYYTVKANYEKLSSAECFRGMIEKHRRNG